MATIEEWIELTDNKLKTDDVFIHANHLGKLSSEEIKEWIIREEDKKDYQNYYPIKTTSNGIRFCCVYVNVNKKDKEFGKLFRLTAHVSGDVEINEETFYEELMEKYPKTN